MTDEGAFRVSDPGHEAVSPIWSSKNLLAFYDATSMSIEILKFDDEGEFDLLHSVPNELELLGSWSPDGRYLVFTEVEFPEPGVLGSAEAGSEVTLFYSHIYRLDTLTGDVIDLTSPKIGLVEDASPLYSPDGQMIAFSRKFLDEERWDLGRQLWLMDPNGQDQTALSDAPIYAHTNFTWDPDATTIASMRVNQSDPTEPVEIWVYEVSTAKAQRALESGYMPQWVP
jgi:Tol biopolymer transport system component